MNDCRCNPTCGVLSVQTRVRSRNRCVIVPRPMGGVEVSSWSRTARLTCVASSRERHHHAGELSNGNRTHQFRRKHMAAQVAGRQWAIALELERTLEAGLGHLLLNKWRRLMHRRGNFCDLLDIPALEILTDSAGFRKNNKIERVSMWNLFSSGMCVYDWSAWDGTLITNICADARRIRAKFEERPEHLLRRLPRRADRVLVHLDISEHSPFPAASTEIASALSARGIEILNFNVRDIRKRTIQSACIAYGLPALLPTPIGPDDELLIVKTDLNSGGRREQQLPKRLKQRLNLPLQLGLIKTPKEYFVCHRAALTAELWNDPELVIERYVTNPAGRFFRVYVMKGALVISSGCTQNPLKRMGDHRGQEEPLALAEGRSRRAVRRQSQLAGRSAAHAWRVHRALWCRLRSN